MYCENTERLYYSIDSLISGKMRKNMRGLSEGMYTLISRPRNEMTELEKEMSLLSVFQDSFLASFLKKGDVFTLRLIEYAFS